MPIALKEWAVTVRALAEGEQLITLRKGGVREPEKHFKLDHDRFFLYPTFDHQRNDLVRESHQPELRRALEEGVWNDGEPSVNASASKVASSSPARAHQGLGGSGGHFTISDPRCVDALSPFYVWTPDYAEKRLEWKRRHPLHVLLLRTYRIPRPVTVKVKDEYGVCSSRLELQRELPFEGTPVLSDGEFSEPPKRSRASRAKPVSRWASRSSSERAFPQVSAPYLQVKEDRAACGAPRTVHAPSGGSAHVPTRTAIGIARPAAPARDPLGRRARARRAHPPR